MLHVTDRAPWRGRAWLGAVVAALVAGVAITASASAAAVPAGVAARPSSPSSVSCAVSYRVRLGDTLSSIAERFHTTVAALARANHIDPADLLIAGVVLTIPQRCESSVSLPKPAPKRATKPASRPATKKSALAVLLGRAVGVPGVALSQTGVVVVDLESSSVAYAVNAETPLEPASTEKLPVAITALARLGATFRTETAVLGQGELVGTTWRGNLVLKGYGDPALSSQGLAGLARAVRNRGIVSVTGRVIGDESYFDDARTAPGWKPSYAKDESPLLSALIVNRGRLDGASVDHPALAAAILFTRALGKAGVSVARKPDVGTAAPKAVKIVRRVSPPLITLLAQMDTWSDNFTAEMILKEIGARVARRGTTAAGVKVVRSTLADHGIPLGGVRLVDGSGLSSLDRLTARSLAAMLETVAHEPALRPLLDSFAVAGSTGTLRHRLLAVPGHELVKGKTGTTDHSSALAGFVGSRWAFAVVCNGSPVNWSAAHLLQDRVAETLLAELS